MPAADKLAPAPGKDPTALRRRSVRMLSQAHRLRPIVVAWLFAGALALVSVATVLADGGGVPYPH